ncbi:SDR family NAD(P)-dependent oxidoreductase [Actinokineospora pegani]|uniref:SDR family NAD(P)-dependent oxidoreductase n=1 Tax=Actinokineospora pegani TaxID=2654637 RepID=UPI0018D2D709|nr:SDR family oxidoreductase [Actinokineospora pegani]
MPTAVITGGGSGIGRALAHEFARDHQVLIVGRDPRSLAATADGHPSVHTLALDLTHSDAPDRVVTTALDRLGGIDLLVNNAGAATPAPLAEVDRASVESQIAVNLTAPVLLTARALDALAEAPGTVLNLTSAGSTGGRAWPGFSVYGATKLAVEQLTRTWAVELAPRGIRVLAIAAGVVASGMGLRMGSSQEQYDGFLAQAAAATPLGRVATPGEIAGWARGLAAPEASFATGAIITVDGGLSLGAGFP